MKIFKDMNLKEEVHILDLGIVQAGDSKEYTFYVYNDTNASLKNLKCNKEHSEIEILSFPETIDSKTISKFTLKWTPSVTLKEGLKTQIKITGIELWS